jgi:hypothetical protein
MVADWDCSQGVPECGPPEYLAGATASAVFLGIGDRWMAARHKYSTRSSAIRAAKQAARAALGPIFEAAEGPDFLIHPEHDYEAPIRSKRGRLDLGDRWSFELVGPAANPGAEERENARQAWARRREPRS